MVWSRQFFGKITNATCSEKEPLYKAAVLKISWLSIIGLGNFYSEHYFDGAFELMEGVIAIFSIIVWPH